MKNLFENWRNFEKNLSLLNEIDIGAPPWTSMPKDEVLIFLKDIGKGTSFRDLVGRLLIYGGKEFYVKDAITIIDKLVEDGYLVIDKSPGTSYLPGQYPKQDLPEKQRWKVKTTKKLQKYLDKPWKISWSKDKGPRKRKLNISRSELMKLDLNLDDTSKEFFKNLTPTAEDYKQVLNNAPGGGDWSREWMLGDPVDDLIGALEQGYDVTQPRVRGPGGVRQSQEILHNLVLKLSGDTGTYNPADGDMLFWDRETNRLAVVKTHPEIRGIIRLPEEITWNPRSSNSLIVNNIPIKLDDLNSNPLLNWNPEYVPKEYNRFWTGRNARITPPQMRLPTRPEELGDIEDFKRAGFGKPDLPEPPLPDEARQMAIDAGWEAEPPEGETPEQKKQRLDKNRNNSNRIVREFQSLEDAREQAKLNDPARAILFDDNLSERQRKIKERKLNKKIKQLQKRSLDPQELAEAIDEANLEVNREIILIQAKEKSNLEQAARIRNMSPSERLAQYGFRTVKIVGGIISVLLLIVVIMFVWAIVDLNSMRKFLGSLGIEGGMQWLLDSFLDATLGSDIETSWRDKAIERGVEIPTDFEGAKALLIREMHPDQLRDLVKLSGVALANMFNPADPTGVVDQGLFLAWKKEWSIWNSQIGLPFEQKKKGRLGDFLRANALHYLCMQKTYGLNAEGPNKWNPKDSQQDWKARMLGYRKTEAGKWTADFDNPARGEKEYRELVKNGFWQRRGGEPKDPCSELATVLDFSKEDEQQRQEAEKSAFKQLTGMDYSNENLKKVIDDSNINQSKFLERFSNLVNQYITRRGGSPSSQFVGGDRSPGRMQTLPATETDPDILKRRPPIEEAKHIKLKIIKEQTLSKTKIKQNNIKYIKLKILNESKK